MKPDSITKEVKDKYIVVDNTFLRDVKDNPKDTIRVEIGDSKQPDFKPQFKVMRWDNEVNFSLRAQEHPEATISIDKEVIKYITPDYEVHQYDKPDAGEDGGYEFEWVLPKKPKSNILTATIQTKGLDFFYQPALTDQEIDEGGFRPDNVVGSYAVYHSTKGGMNDSAGMEYKTGKAFHIYRPEAKDADGNKTWCELNIDTDNGLLTVTVPEAFLKTASYPVVVDPTFGYTSAGAAGNTTSYRQNSSTKYSYRTGNVYAGVDGTVTQINVFLKHPTANDTIDHTVFLNINDTVDSTHDEVGNKENTEISLTASYQDIAFDVDDFAVSSANEYLFSVLGNGLDEAVDGRYSLVAWDTTDGGDAGSETYTNAYTKESPWSVVLQTGVNQRKHSIYATYTSSGSPSSSSSSSISPSASSSLSASASSSASSSISLSPSSSVSSSISLSPSPSSSVSLSVSPSPSPSAGFSPSSSVSSSISLSPSVSVSSSISPSLSLSPSLSPSSSVSLSPSPSVSSSISLSPSPSPSLSISLSPSLSPSASPSPSSSVSRSPSPSAGGIVLFRYTGSAWTPANFNVFLG